MSRVIKTKTVFGILIMCLTISLADSPPQDNWVKDPDPVRFRDEIARFSQWDAKNSTPGDAVLFIGSSSIRGWATAQAFPGFPVINRGFGGSHISDVLYYYNQVVSGYDARIIVLYAGDNDVADGKSPQQVFEQYRMLAERIHQDFPDTDLIYLPIKPSISRWKYWPAMNAANLLIKEYTDSYDYLYYTDVAGPMLNDAGRPDDGLFVRDGLHLNMNGYQLWQSVLTPVLQQLYKHR